MLLALKVDVDTFRGTRDGAPALLQLLRKHEAAATFLWSLGRDHTGRAVRRVLRPGFLQKVQRTSVVKHYGLRTLLYGTLLPGPDIGRRGRSVMQSVRDEGFEVGIHTWDHIRWQDGVVGADAAWTQAEMLRACERFTDIFKADPKVHGAAGWQMNVHALRLTQRFNFDYASDSRGIYPFLPVWNGELIRCPQFPTTLPTLDELIGRDGIDETNVADHLLALTEEPQDDFQVFTLHAELEGMLLIPVFEQLLIGWKAQGWELVSMRTLYDSVQPMALPRCEVALGEITGRSGTLLKQGDEFLAECIPVDHSYDSLDVAA
jgi:peptidoglycan/xylan/chitin deacetylase (PgdA/CDA1 family)